MASCFITGDHSKFALFFLLQLDAAHSDDEVRDIFDDPDHELVMLETGYRKPLSSLAVSDKEAVQKTLKTHLLARVKPEMDQFCEGLDVCGILENIRKYSSLMTSFFIYTPMDLTAGMLLCVCLNSWHFVGISLSGPERRIGQVGPWPYQYLSTSKFKYSF